MKTNNTFDARNTWFTADTHFYDKALFRRGCRPFGSVEEMNRELIRRWNETVPDHGVVFHLGDFSQGGCREWKDVLSQLHGRIYLIRGNHDDMPLRMMKYKKTFEQVVPQKTIHVEGQDIILNHYPFLFYQGELDHVWQLFGHIHSGSYKETGFDLPRMNLLFPFQYDVGVDNNDYRPVSFLQVKTIITAQAKAAKIRSGKEDERSSFSSLNENIPEFVTREGLLEAAEAYYVADRNLHAYYGMDALKEKEEAGDQLYRKTSAFLQHGMVLPLFENAEKQKRT